MGEINTGGQCPESEGSVEEDAIVLEIRRDKERMIEMGQMQVDKLLEKAIGSNADNEMIQSIRELRESVTLAIGAEYDRLEADYKKRLALINEKYDPKKWQKMVDEIAQSHYPEHLDFPSVPEDNDRF